MRCGIRKRKPARKSNPSPDKMKKLLLAHAPKGFAVKRSSCVVTSAAVFSFSFAGSKYLVLALARMCFSPIRFMCNVASYHECLHQGIFSFVFIRLCSSCHCIMTDVWSVSDGDAQVLAIGRRTNRPHLSVFTLSFASF